MWGWFVFSSDVCPAVALECAAGSNRLGVLFCCCCSHGWFFLRTKVGKRHSFLVTAATECQNRQGARARKGGGGKLGHNKQTREVWRKERGITRQCENCWLVGWLDRLVRLEMSGRGKSAPTRLVVWAARDKGVKTLWKGDIYAWFVCCFFFAKGEKRPFADALQIGGTKTKGALFFFLLLLLLCARQSPGERGERGFCTTNGVSVCALTHSRVCLSALSVWFCLSVCQLSVRPEGSSEGGRGGAVGASGASPRAAPVRSPAAARPCGETWASWRGPTPAAGRGRRRRSRRCCRGRASPQPPRRPPCGPA